MQEPHWISKEAALAMHHRQLAEHGGIQGIRDESLLESALGEPQDLFVYSNTTVDMAHLAASYTYGIVMNHPFLDGNKRTALVVGRTFLLLNGYNLITSQEEKYMAIINIASSTWSEKQLARWFTENIEAI